MLKIYPEIEFTANCPQDNAELDIKKVVIPGMRCLANTHCPICENDYYVELPVSHALWSSIILNQSTAEIYDPLNVEWFSHHLKQEFLNPIETEIVPIVHNFFDAEKIIIINCLDFLYGHSLLKLLSVQRYLDNYPELGCCVLIPTQLVHLVPDGVAEIWEFPIPIKEGWQWYPSLENWINQQIEKRRECFLSRAYSHPSNKIYDLDRFVSNLPDISANIRNSEPIILFSYREDRLWGRNLVHQQHNLQKLYTQLREIFPNLAFVLVGFGKNNKIKETGTNLIDLRTDSFSVEIDRLWMAYMKVADCAVGVHGSNMLLPSGLAKSTIELLPSSRFGNSVQDFLFSQDKQDIRDGLLFYRMIYGNETLSNIKAIDLSEILQKQIDTSTLMSSWLKFDVNNTVDSHNLLKLQQKHLSRQKTMQDLRNKKNNFYEKVKKLLDQLLLL